MRISDWSSDVCSSDLMGLPVFTGIPGCGLAYMAGPTAGFLLGFIAAAYVSGTLVERGWGNSIGGALVVFICGDLALYVPGVLWLMYLMGFDAKIGRASCRERVVQYV